jgi:ketosteroid isomerase-like protein
MARDFTKEDSNKSLVQASFDRWKTQSGGPFELLDSDVEWTMVGSSPLAKTKNAKVMKAIAFFDNSHFDEFWNRVSPTHPEIVDRAPSTSNSPRR